MLNVLNIQMYLNSNIKSDFTSFFNQHRTFVYFVVLIKKIVFQNTKYYLFKVLCTRDWAPSDLRIPKCQGMVMKIQHKFSFNIVTTQEI